MDVFYHSCLLRISGDPRSSSYISSLPELCRGWKKSTLHHLHSIRIIIPRNALQSLWEVKGMKHRGNHLPPVIISHLSAALDEDPDGLGGSHVQAADGRTDREKGLMWLWCPENISNLSRFWQHSSSSGDWQHTSISLMFCLSGFLLSTDFKTLNLSLWRCVELLNIPKWAPFGFFTIKKNLPGGWSICGPVRICERFLEEFFVGHCGVPVWLQNGFAIKSSSKPSNFLKQTDRKTKTLIRLQCPWSISFMDVLAALQVHGGLAAVLRWISLCFEFLFHPWGLHLSLIQRF